MPRTVSLRRPSLLAAALIAVAAAPARAQIRVDLYATVPATDPGLDPTFGGLAPFCTTTLNASSLGFSSAESFAAFAQSACPAGSVPAGFDGFDFAARFVGAFLPPTPGTYQIGEQYFDGLTFYLDGAFVNGAWPSPDSFGADATVTLGAGPNPFVVNFRAGADRTRYAFLNFGAIDPTVTIVAAPAVPEPPTTTTPEPATAGLVTAGLLALGAAARRRRTA